MRLDPGLLVFFFLLALGTLGYFLLKDTFYIRDLEQAVKASPDAQHFLKELARKRKEAADAITAQARGGAEKCEHCGWWKGLRVDDQGHGERQCINSKCPGPKNQ